MAVKVKPDMYCKRCERPIAAQKQTHKARSLLLGPLTYGAAIKVGEWHCPNCGSTDIVPAALVRTPEQQRADQQARVAAQRAKAQRKRERETKRRDRYAELYGPGLIRQHPEIADYYRQWPEGETPTDLHRRVRDAVRAERQPEPAVSKKLRGTRAGRVQQSARRSR